VGYKNSTEGNLQIAVDAMNSARSPHTFLGINQEGQTAIIRTVLDHLVVNPATPGRNTFDPDRFNPIWRL